jgi:hypothetical protein
MRDLDPKACYTIAPVEIPSDMCLKPEFIRLPKPKQVCQYTGLTRSFINLLVLPNKQNGYNPPVKSVKLRLRGAKAGVRLIHFTSLMDYIRRQMDEQSVHYSGS